VRGRPEGLAGLLAALRRADRSLFHQLAEAHNPVLDRVMPALSQAADFSLLWLATAGLMALSGRPGWRRAAGRALAATAVGSLTTNGVAKLTFDRRRPPLDRVPLARRVRRVPVTTSFPSGHTASAAAFATTVALEAPELAPPVAVLAAGVGFSRVWTGAHYPGDVLAGAGIGVTVALCLAPFRWGRWPGRRRRARRGWGSGG
jgi:membrane-associated phospholipid phosphatase